MFGQLVGPLKQRRRSNTRIVLTTERLRLTFARIPGDGASLTHQGTSPDFRNGGIKSVAGLTAPAGLLEMGVSVGHGQSYPVLWRAAPRVAPSVALHVDASGASHVPGGGGVFVLVQAGGLMAAVMVWPACQVGCLPVLCGGCSASVRWHRQQRVFGSLLAAARTSADCLWWVPLWWGGFMCGPLARRCALPLSAGALLLDRTIASWVNHCKHVWLVVARFRGGNAAMAVDGPVVLRVAALSRPAGE